MNYKKLDLLVLSLLAVLGLYVQYLVFIYVPDEAQMGAVQRIFYFHVGSAMAAYLCIAGVFLGSVVYLAQSKLEMDLLAEASGGVGFLFCTVVLLTGMIWGHAAWGTWFNWEPRLLTFLLLWLVFLGYVLLRAYSRASNLKKHSAVLGIVGSCMVPLMVFSIRILPQIKQLHPQVVSQGGLRDPRMGFALVITILFCSLFAGFLTYLSYRSLRLRSRSLERMN